MLPKAALSCKKGVAQAHGHRHDDVQWLGKMYTCMQLSAATGLVNWLAWC